MGIRDLTWVSGVLLMGLVAFASQCDWVTHSHTIPLVWFSSTITSPPITHLAPNCSQPPMHVPTLSRGMWAYLIRGYGRKNTRGTQQVGGPVGVSQEWAMTHGLFSLIPLFWTPTNAPPTSCHIGCVDLTMQTYVATNMMRTGPPHAMANTMATPTSTLPPSQTQPSDYN